MLLKDRLSVPSNEQMLTLPTISYSGLEKYKNCPYNYKLHYIENHRSPQEAIHLDIGTLCHKVLELKGRAKKESVKVDYSYLVQVFENGIEEATDKGSECILGVTEIKTKWGEELFKEPDNATGQTYEEKLSTFRDVVLRKELEDEWQVLGTEEEFNIVFNYSISGDVPNEAVILHGFIDCVLCKKDIDGEIKEIKIVDYKTSKKTFSQSYANNSLQMFIYGMATFLKYGIFPSEYEYHFILLDEIQRACSPNYQQRCQEDLIEYLRSIFGGEKHFAPKPSPLCYWCSFCKNNPTAHSPYKSMCEYHSLWTPESKRFAVNKKFDEENLLKKPKRSFNW